MFQAAAGTGREVSKLCEHDGERKFLPRGDAEPASRLPVQDPDLLAEQEQFEVLRMIGLGSDDDEIEQEGQ